MVIHAAGLVKARTRADFVAVQRARAPAAWRRGGRRAPARGAGLQPDGPRAAALALQRQQARRREAMAETSWPTASPSRARRHLRPRRSRDCCRCSRPPARARSCPLLAAEGARGDDPRRGRRPAQSPPLLRAAAGLSPLATPGRDGYGWRELMAAPPAAAPCGRTPRPCAAAGGARERLGITLIAHGLGARPMLTSAKARELLHPDWAVAPEERRRAAPAPQFDLRSGFSHTVDVVPQCGMDETLAADL